MEKGPTCGLNFVYLFLAVCAIVVICWSLACIIPFRELIGNGFTAAQIIFFLSTLSALALAIMGIVGYQKRSHKLTLSFSVSVLLLSILFILVGVMVTLELLKLRPILRGRLLRLYLAYNDSTDNDIYDYIQYQYECCGFYNYTDWYYNSTHPGHLNRMFPLSCCQPKSRGSLRHEVCRNAGINMDYLRRNGCYSKAYQVAINGALPVIILAFIIAVTGIPCSTMSFILSNRIRNENDGSENDDDDEDGDDDDDEDEGDED